ncbi:MAG: sulfite exporter TauE/SafE family protein [Deltaproteobacteria bacterium]|nr:MAG: sulfite exporter TauE/SafE family protein [Deltaproteobacteria bacterium]
MSEPVLTMAFVTGLLGSGHCIGMCGGLVAALSVTDTGRRGGLLFQLLYHLGRTTTYVGLGALVGWVGSILPLKDSLGTITRTLLIGSDLLIVLLGLGTAGAFAWLNLNRLEFPGPARSMAGLLRRFRQWPPALAALPVGLLMGWLPCGFVYAMLLTTAQGGSAPLGAGTMLLFGLGTTPALLAFGGTASWLGQKARVWMLRGAGLAVAVIGILHLVRHLNMPA